MLINDAKSCIIDGVNLLSSYGLFLASVNQSGGANILNNHSEYDISTDKTSKSDTFNIIGRSFTEPIKFTIQLFHLDEKNIRPDELETINRVFVHGGNSYIPFQFYGDIRYSNIVYYVVCDAVRVVKVNDINGVEISLVTNSAYAHSLNKYKNTFSVVNNTQIKLIDMNGVANKQIIPDLKIICNGNGDLSIHNDMTNKTFEIKGCIQNEVITINGFTQEIISNIRNHTQLFNAFNYVYLTLGNKFNDRKNNLTFTGINATVTIEYRINKLLGV